MLNYKRVGRHAYCWIFGENKHFVNSTYFLIFQKKRQKEDYFFENVLMKLCETS
jgi:hypothetical protein